MPNMKWLLTYIKGNRWAYVVGFLMVIVTGLLGVVMTGVQKYIIDQVLVEGSNTHFLRYIILLSVSVLGFSVLMLLSNVLMMRNRYKILLRMGKDFVNGLHRLSADSVRKLQTGKTVNDFVTDTDLIGNMLAYLASWIVMHATTAIIVIAALAYFSPITLIAVLGVSAAYMLMARYFGKKTYDVYTETNASRSRLMAAIQECISATRETLAFGRRQQERTRLEGLFADYVDKSMQEVKLQNRQMLTSEPFRWICQLAVLGYGGYAVITDNMTIGTLVVAFQFSTRLMYSMHEGFGMVTEFRGRMANVERLRKSLDHEPLPDGARELEDRVESLSLNQVSFRYEPARDWVLRRVDLHIPVGKKVAFVGTSGGGKSTIFQLLLRLYDPDEGGIMVNGAPLTAWRRADWDQRVRGVFQEPYLFPDTIRTNILLGRAITEQQLQEACRIACMDEFITELPEGLGTEVGERGIILSGGQRQRVALTRAILDQPEVLILDEATSFLDVDTERRMMKNLDEHREGLTTIVIAHRLSTIVNADLIYVMEQGCVAEAGTHLELMQMKGMYYSLYHASEDAA